MTNIVGLSASQPAVDSGEKMREALERIIAIDQRTKTEVDYSHGEDREYKYEVKSDGPAAAIARAALSQVGSEAE